MNDAQKWQTERDCIEAKYKESIEALGPKPVVKELPESHEDLTDDHIVKISKALKDRGITAVERGSIFSLLSWETLLNLDAIIHSGDRLAKGRLEFEFAGQKRLRKIDVYDEATAESFLTPIEQKVNAVQEECARLDLKGSTFVRYCEQLEEI
jgi:hypothetical protein